MAVMKLEDGCLKVVLALAREAALPYLIDKTFEAEVPPSTTASGLSPIQVS